MATWFDVWRALETERPLSADAIGIELAADTADVERASRALGSAGIVGLVEEQYRRTAEAGSESEVEQLAAAAGIALNTNLAPRQR